MPKSLPLTSWKILALLAVSLFAASCTTINIPPPLSSSAQPPCLPTLLQLDQLAYKYSGTLSDQRISDTPWLRNNRFLHSFQHEDQSQAQLQAMLHRMNQRAIGGLSTETRQIPPRQLQQWATSRQVKSTPAVFIQNCAKQLLNEQLAQPEKTKDWLQQLDIADSYSTLQRAVGLYPIAAIPFRRGVVKEQKDLEQQWGDTQGKQWTSYAPQRSTNNFALESAKLRQDALNIPVMDVQKAQRLLAQHAPTWLVDSQSSANKPGAPYKSNNNLAVDTSEPVTYTHLSFGRWQNQITTQLNYIIWFTERPALNRLDWVAGKHDAVIFRVHLDAAQNILAYDSIHLCGCWYRLFVPEDTKFEANNSNTKEPIAAQTVRAARQMQVYVSRDTHQIVDLRPIARNASIGQKYQVRRFSELLNVPIFNRQGYVPGSNRLERWFFWPMGVKNPGAVRRFSEHAVSFIGKRHFDDPYLLEEVGIRQ